MADDDGMTSTAEGTESNEPINQTPDQFSDGGAADAAEAAEAAPPKNHATKGMTTFGYADASRIEDTTATEEAERKAFEKAQAKAEKKES